MTNVTVSDCTVKGKRNVGGFVGYVDGNATFSGCTSANVNTTASGDPATISAATDYKTTGAVVGVFKGNAEGETLTFDADCSVTSYTTGAGAYIAANQSCWVADGSETWSGTPDTKYDNALGNEEFCRGTVKYGSVRIIPHWDGKRTVAPIGTAANGTVSTCEIWSPFDLAYLQGKSLTTIEFKIDVDMTGVCPDCKNGNGNSTISNDELSTCSNCKAFTPIVELNNLTGNNKTLYNLFVQGTHEVGGKHNDGMGFIRHTNTGTYKDFTFDGAIIKCIDDIRYRNDDQNGGNAYAGTLTSRVAASMTITNVHAKNGHVIGISKFGGLIGYVPGGITANGCSVDNYIIENHKINVINSYSVSIEKEALGMQLKAECAENFYTEGEAGGLIGFISSNASITDCHTSNITMKCYGQADRKTKIKTYRWTRDWIPTGLFSGYYTEYYWKSTGINIDYTIAGRHVNTFIGDIRTPNSNTVTINSCTTSGTSANGYDYNITKTGKGELVGCCYFVGKDIEFLGVSMHAGDYKGTVTIDDEDMPFVGG